MQHRIKLSTTLLIAIKGRKNKIRSIQPKVAGITLANRAVAKSKSISVNAEGNMVMLEKRKYQIL